MESREPQNQGSPITVSSPQPAPIRRKHAPEYKITVASKLDNLAKIGGFIAETGQRLKLGDDFTYDAQVAVEEACTNIIRHAYAMRADRPIVIGCRLRNDEFIIRIRDFGQPFAPESVARPKFSKRIAERRSGGLGLYLMKKLVNRVKFKFDEARGNELTMVKRVPEPVPDAGEAADGA